MTLHTLINRSCQKENQRKKNCKNDCCCHSRKIFLSFPCPAPSIIAAVAANLISPVYPITDAVPIYSMIFAVFARGIASATPVPCAVLTYHLISSCCTFPMILVRITPSTAPVSI
ncbi:MAG: hypothetical protein K2M22_11425, partial [Lachnospiraceae bacterium]|nr:hypothetical protein [Lachnospiraceae bacterium]